MWNEDKDFIDALRATKVEYRQLGRCGLRVSVPILGTMGFGDPDWQHWQLDEAQSLQILKAAYDRGLNTWDTANLYSNGKSEAIIGKALKEYRIPRHEVVIMTKCWGYVGAATWMPKFKEMPNCMQYVNQGGLSRQAIFYAVDQSLARLGTDYIDLLQIHRFDPNVPIEETMEALHDLIKMGKVRYIGASSMWTYQFVMMQACAEAHGWTKFVSMQNHYSLLYREEEREMVRYCRLTGVGIIPWGPLCRGALARPPGSAETNRSKEDKAKTGHSEIDEKIVERVHEVAVKKGCQMSHVALAWICKRVTSPIVGIHSVERMDEILGIRGKELTDGEESYLEELYRAREVEGHS